MRTREFRGFGRIHAIEPSLFAISVLLLWELAVAVFDVPVYVLPSPSQIAATFFSPRIQLFANFKVTALEAGLGFLLGSLVGGILGAAMAESSVLKRAILPFVVGSNAVPVIAVAPLFLMWFGYGLLSRIMAAAFLCFFPLAINTYRGLSNDTWSELFDVYGATRWQYLAFARLPAAMPFIFAGAKLNATFAVIGAIVAEFMGTSAGLGYGMLQSVYRTDTRSLWVYLLTAIALGGAGYFIVWLLEEKWGSRYESKAAA